MGKFFYGEAQNPFLKREFLTKFFYGEQYTKMLDQKQSKTKTKSNKALRVDLIDHEINKWDK